MADLLTVEEIEKGMWFHKESVLALAKEVARLTERLASADKEIEEANEELSCAGIKSEFELVGGIHTLRQERNKLFQDGRSLKLQLRNITSVAERVWSTVPKYLNAHHEELYLAFTKSLKVLGPDKPQCNDICLRAGDVGVAVKGNPVAYAHPHCEEHNPPREEVERDENHAASNDAANQEGVQKPGSK